MKKIILLLLITINVYSQEQHQEITITKDGSGEYVYDVPGQSSIDIFGKVKTFIVKNYTDPKWAILSEEPGKFLKFKGFKSIDSGFTSGGDYFYSCFIEFKDNKYRISFSDLYMTNMARTWDIKQCFRKDGEVRHYDAYRNMVTNATIAVNEMNSIINNEVLNKDTKW